MALLKDIYSLTEYVRDNDGTDEELRYGTDGLNQREAWVQYAKAKGLPESYWVNVGNTALTKGYLTYGPADIGSHPPHKIFLGAEGTEILDSTKHGNLPIGLVLAYMNKYHVLTSLLWIIIGLILGNLGTIAHFIEKL